MPATATPGLRDRLKDIQAKIDEARDQRAEALKEKEAAKEAFERADLQATDITRSPEFLAAEKAVGRVGALDDQIADLQAAERGVLAMLGERAPEAARAARDGNGPQDGVTAAPGGFNARDLIDSDAVQAFLASSIPTSRAAIGTVEWGRLASREEFLSFLAAAVGSDNKQGAIPADRRGIVAPLLKPLTLLDLIPTGTTDSNSVEYVQVTTIPSSAAETEEGRLKPEQSFVTRDASAPVRTIAGWIKVLRQALQDVSGLEHLLGVLLPYDVRRRIEAQMIAGDGRGQNIQGILATTGIGEPAPVAGDNTADAILRAITTIYLADGDPNFAALHPLVWQDLLLMRENQAERTGMYLYGSPSSPAAPTIWGLSITTNRAVPADQSLVGDANGASLLVREGVNVRVTDTDQDDFVNNRATIRAEARVAFPIWRPSSFAVAATGQTVGS